MSYFSVELERRRDLKKNLPAPKYPNYERCHFCQRLVPLKMAIRRPDNIHISWSCPECDKKNKTKTKNEVSKLLGFSNADELMKWMEK